MSPHRHPAARLPARGVAECRTRPEAFARCDYVGQLLREVDVPHCQVVPRPERVPDESLTVEYYVAHDHERFGLLPDPYRTAPDEVLPADDVPIGRVVGHPEDTVSRTLAKGTFTRTDSISMVGGHPAEPPERSRRTRD